MRAATLLLATLSLPFLAPAWADSSVLSEKLGNMTRSLVSGYKTARPSAAGRQTAAIFTFNAPDKLQKQRVGFAVSEFLTHHLVNDQTFTIVERSELAKVMGEQRLHVTGAVDPATAVQVGKLAGARYLIMGSVERVGGSYHMNARVVEVETADIVTATFAEVSIETFEDEAKPYLVLVPDRQTIGLYLLYNHRQNASAGRPYSDSSGFYGGTVTPQSASLGMVGGGIRYLPSASWMVEAGIALIAGQEKSGVGTGSSSCEPTVAVYF